MRIALRLAAKVTVALISASVVGHAHAGDLSPSDYPAATQASTQPNQPPSENASAASGWVFSANGYVWATGVSGNVRTLPPLPIVHVEARFDQLVRNLDGALMGAVEARHGRLILAGDAMYVRLSPTEDLPGPGPTEVAHLRSTSLTSLVAVGYRAYDTPNLTLDGFVGVRGVYLDNTLSVAIPAAAQTLSLERAETWAAAAVGARAQVKLTDHIQVVAIGFGGGFQGSSNSFEDGSVTLHYNFARRFSIFGGYRAVKTQFIHGPFLYDVVENGPLVGASATF